VQTGLQLRRHAPRQQSTHVAIGGRHQSRGELPGPRSRSSSQPIKKPRVRSCVPASTPLGHASRSGRKLRRQVAILWFGRWRRANGRSHVSRLGHTLTHGGVRRHNEQTSVRTFNLRPWTIRIGRPPGIWLPRDVNAGTPTRRGVFWSG
jgi:hypothetical protein